MIKIPFKIKAFTYLIIFLLLPLLSAESTVADSEGLHDPMSKAQTLCDMDPMNSRCKKFLDGKYRRHNDAEKAPLKVDDIPGAHLDEKSYEGELKRELLSFCRKEPESYRCKKIKR